MSQRTVNPRRPSHAPPGPRLTALEPITSDAPLAGFAEFGVSKPVVDALKMRGISGAFSIQELVLRDAIAGRDVLARSRTGSGKTLAFAVPIVERLTPSNESPTALILAPTRELASQVTEEFRAIADVRRLHVAAVYGGVANGPQAKRARRADIVIATPGRRSTWWRAGCSAWTACGSACSTRRTACSTWVPARRERILEISAPIARRGCSRPRSTPSGGSPRGSRTTR